MTNVFSCTPTRYVDKNEYKMFKKKNKKTLLSLTCVLYQLLPEYIHVYTVVLA